MDLTTHPHRRLNILTGEWILVSPHRTKRPWQGKVESLPKGNLPAYDPKCYLCPSNERAGGFKNPAYTNTFVFDNDFAALLSDTPAESIDENSLLVAQSERGICKVICFSPRHDLTLALMDIPDISKVIDVWKQEYATLGAVDYINYVQIFENRGDIMGCSNPHPHGQVWANETVPAIPAQETKCQHEYLLKNSRCMLCDYVKTEQQAKERIVASNDRFIAVVPFWAVWPYEIMILPTFHARSLSDLEPGDDQLLAEIFREVCIRFDNLFETSFPYSMGIHQAPTDGAPHSEWHLHFHFYPPLLRSATVKKFMVGYEMLAQPQRDISAEQAAAKLRELSGVHYLRR